MGWYGSTSAGKRAKLATRGKRRRERERAARTEAPRLTLDQLWDKYKGTCQLCWLPIGDRAEASIEHTVPLSKGGVDDETNQKLAHSGCNAKKGNRTKPKAKGLKRGMWRRKVKSKIPEGSPDVF